MDNTDIQCFSPANISCLFSEILTIIFQHLSVSDRGRVAQVSVKWRDAAYNRRVWRNVVAKIHLQKSTASVLFPSLIQRGIVKIQILSLTKHLKDVIGIPKLEMLDLSGCYNVIDRHISKAFNNATLPYMSHLNLSLCKSITDASVEKISKLLPNLIQLDLAGCCNVSADGLMYIAWGLPKLQSLNLRSCSMISDRGIGNICGQNEQVTGAKGNLVLETLILQDCQKITDHALNHISVGLVNLKALNISFCSRITDSGLRFVAKMNSLQCLTLKMCQEISDIGIGYLSNGANSIHSIDISFCVRISDETLIHISQGLFQLKKLCLCNANITDEGVKKMVLTCRDLEILNIGQCKHITDSSLENIAKNLKRLRQVDLYGCTNITKEGLQKLSQLPSIQKMNLELYQK